MTAVLRLFTFTCEGNKTTWEGYRAIRCAGIYRPVDIARVLYSTLDELGIDRLGGAMQRVLIVRVSPVRIYIVDAIFTTRADASVGASFISSFHLLLT